MYVRNRRYSSFVMNGMNDEYELFHRVNFTLKKYTLGKSSSRSPGNFNILAKLSNIQKLLLFQRNALYIRSIFSNQTIIVIHRLTQFLELKKDGILIL